jgi:hypothetical protein
MRGKLSLILAVIVTGVAALALTRRPAAPDVPHPAEVGAAGDASREVQLRIFAKVLVADEVAAGRRSLPEAAALFAALNRLPPGPVADPHLPFRTWSRHLPDRTAEQQLCLQVIGYVAMADTKDAAAIAAAVARLEEVFAGELRRYGVIRLPAAPAAAADEFMERARAGLDRSRVRAADRR